MVAVFDEARAAQRAARDLGVHGVRAHMLHLTEDEDSPPVPAAIVVAALVGIVLGAVGLLVFVAARWPSPLPVAGAVVAGAAAGFVGGAWVAHGGLAVLARRGQVSPRTLLQVEVRSDEDLPRVVGVLWADGARRLSVARAPAA